MREQIKAELVRRYQDALSFEEEELVKETLNVVWEEIEKVENPYKDRPLFYDKDSGFEQCRQAILKILEEK